MQAISEITFSFQNIFDFEGITVNPVVIISSFLILIGIIVGIFIVLTFLKKDEPMTTRDITMGSICLALSYVLSLIGYRMPFGGIITLCSLLPITVFCHYKGFRKSLPFVTVYMVLQLITQPYIVSVWSMLLDYAVPFLSIAIVGLVPYKQGETGLKSHMWYYILMLLYIVIAFSSYILSGILFWDFSADYGMTTIPYVLAYDSFCLIDFAICVVVSVPILSSKQMNKVFRNSL